MQYSIDKALEKYDVDRKTSEHKNKLSNFIEFAVFFFQKWLYIKKQETENIDHELVEWIFINIK